MFSDGFRQILDQLGEEAEICRGGVLVGKASALPRQNQPCLEFLPETDLLAGDDVLLVLSQKRYAIERVERHVVGKELINLKAFYSEPHQRGHASVTVHGSFIAARDIVNSAIQAHSPGATQNLNVTNTDAKERTKDAIRLVLEILDELDLTADEVEEVKADAESAEAQLKSPKTRWSHVKDILAGVRDKVKKGVTDKVAKVVMAKGQQAIEWLNQALSSMGGS